MREEFSLSEVPEIESSSEAIDLASVEILGEIVELRNESAKHFQLAGGNSVAVVYPCPVHVRETEDEPWEEIDNTLSEVVEKGTARIKNKASAGMQASFAKDAASDVLLRLSEGKREVSMRLESDGLLSASAQIGERVSAKSALTQDNLVKKDSLAKSDIIEKVSDAEKMAERYERNLEKLAVSNIASAVKYENVLSGTDIEYTVSPRGVKENIIVKSPQKSYEYVFALNAGDMTAVKNDGNTISLFDGEEEVFIISAPLMSDASGEFSLALTLELLESQAGMQEAADAIRIKLTADPDWINTPERVFPVVIDPTIKTKQSQSAITDTYVDSRWPTAQNYAQQYVIVGKHDGGANDNGTQRTYLKFTLPTIPQGSIVNQAQLALAQYGHNPGTTTSPMNMYLYKVTSPWDSSVTWNTQPACDTTITDYVGYSMSLGNWKTWDITSIVKDWYEDAAPNYGVVIKSSNESVVKREVFFSSHVSSSVAYPLILFHYVNNYGLEDYWTYTSFSAGRAGTAYVNDYTGNLVFVHDNAATSGLLMPVTLSSIHNGYMDKVNLPGGASGEVRNGPGWIFNFRRKVEETPNNDADPDLKTNYPYIYSDGDGTRHYFMKKTENGVTKYCDEDGLGLELVRTGTGTNLTCTIKDEKDNVMSFRADGYLTEIRDANGNTATVTYAASSARIEKITDGSGHEITVNAPVDANGNYNLNSITDPANRKTTYSHASADGTLIKITYPDGTFTSFTYDADKAISSVTAPDGYKLEFSYTSPAQGKRVSRVIEYGGSEIGRTVVFDRSQRNVTTIRTHS